MAKPKVKPKSSYTKNVTAWRPKTIKKNTKVK